MKISIITPSYNQGQFIERTILSVANQAGGEIEHVVFDGGSTDNTVEILKNASSLHSWVSEKDKGQTDAVNKGIAATSGEIIGWLNSDDIYYPEAIASVLNFFAENPDIDVVYGMADHIDLDDHAFETYPTEPWSLERLKSVCIICQPALFFRRRVVEKYGLLDTSLNYCMDYEYWLRLGKAGVKFAYLEKKLAGSRLYADNKTLGSRTKVHAEINGMFKTKFGQVPPVWLINYAHAVTESKIVREKHPIWYLSSLLITSVSASIHWNKKLSFGFIKMIMKLGMDPIKGKYITPLKKKILTSFSK
ncbi:Chondroitin polymerase [Legionella massiliensis]|uniref:Chondroitin polymerase n=1 Tax=Legionella massiliensis TaxID=1034943 RepID=A0A078KWY2_9GAMM|nr:glycosyltransferase family 2 protein [Legionella massiliensis]CDZ76243.1 Chondroitin polymerase [Legionella massiliensis]CEE11981.1 Chondroitin synthase [Legionella massiliensis]